MAIVTSNGMSNVEWQEWAKLSEQEQQDLLKAEYENADFSLDDLEELQKRLDASADRQTADLERKKIEIDELLDSFRALNLRELGAEERQAVTAEMKALREERTLLIKQTRSGGPNDFKTAFDAIVQEEAGQHVKTRGDYNLSDADVEDVTIDSITNPFDDPNMTDEEYLISKGVIEAQPGDTPVETMGQRIHRDPLEDLRANARRPVLQGSSNPAATVESVQQDSWVAKTDFNGDGIINQDDIDAALAQRHGPVPTVKVQIEGIEWTSCTFDSATKTWTLVGKDEDGKVTSRTIHGNCKLDFSGGISRETSVPMLQGLPPSVRKNIYYNGQSVQELLGGGSVGESSENARLNAIDNYEEVRSQEAFNQAKSSFDPKYGEADVFGPTKSNPDELRAAYELAVDRLFTAYDEGRISEEQMLAAWENMKAELTSPPHNLNQRDWANVIKMVVRSMATHASKEQFQLFIGKAIGFLETDLTTFQANSYKISQDDLAIILIMEQFGGKPGQYADYATRMAHTEGANIVTGSWSDHNANMAAIDEALAIMAQMTSVNTIDATSRLTQIRHHEDSLRLSVAQTGMNTTAASANFKQEYHQQLSPEAQPAIGFHSSMGTRFNNAMFDFITNGLEGVLFDAQGNFVNDPFTAIKDAMTAALNQPVTVNSADGFATSYSPPPATPEMIALGISYLVNSIFTDFYFTENFRNEFMAKFAGPAKAFLEANPLPANHEHRSHYDSALAALSA